MNMRGFTLIEVLVVLAIIAVIMSFGLIISLDSYRGYLFRSERSVLVSTFERARSRALNNYYQSAWGVCYTAPNYIIFKGTTCMTGDTIPANAAIAAASDFSNISKFPPVVFAQLTGKLIPQLSPATEELKIVITQDARSSTISINNEGTINW